MDWWHSVKDWFLGLGEQYHVNPFIFGGIYVGAIPFFFASLSWTINNIRKKKSFLIPSMLTGLFFISAYLYLIVVGQHIPVWAYFFIGVMIVYGMYSAVNKVKRQIKK
ncbi:MULTISPECIES: hypothetical protein [unclassified Mucilaginibacter]|uniref:hypothetical protein n=1 Tax=unclassified Mucilaginibacter TaxID=2617802 RepID=UPI002AC9C3D2|nr:MULTISPECIES: hypothetical protein [unclassified Mucilaginibacter]MEB0262790.1 hypothetical protein [Mucilaginibacter sp. 10I4]MEB0278173.1 hypothetical protein [Mucilaginibacter sp. 10B2]MEB0302055.1 hypothetical protein [Mucilaginibacter sp. 5C4]WPX23820.1 hypothetical protein RHM67_00810 [Mucilaginibacter sp. 5C4]